MDGTLVNSSITIANAINYVRKNLHLEPMDTMAILRLVNDHTINPAKVFYHTTAFDKDHEKWFSEYYTKNHEQELVLYDGIETLLLDIKAKGYALALATNAYRQSTIESLKHLNIYELFDAIGCYDDVKEAKPSPDMLYKVLNEIECHTKEAIFIGDGPRDEMAAKHANIDYIMVDWGFTEHHHAIQTVEALHKLLI